MPIRDWLHNSAIRGCLAFVLALAVIAGVAYWSTDQSAYEKPQQESAYQHQEKDSPSVRADFWTRTGVSPQDTLAQWTMAFFAMLATGVSIWAVRLLKGTLRATRDAVEQAREANTATRAMVTLSEQTAERQLRAYVTMVGIHLTQFEVGKPIKLEIRMKNCGQTPAYDYRGGYTMTTVPNLMAEKFRFNRPVEDQTWSKTVLGPGIETGTLFPNNHILSKTEYDHVTGGSYALFVWGYDAYTDAFGKQQSMWFRYQHTGPIELPQRMMVSPKGNGAT